MSSTFKVCAIRCDECLFSPERIVSSKRMKQVIDACLKDDTFFVCHKFATQGDEGVHGEQVCCKGFWDTFKNDVLITRVAQMCHVVEFVEVEQEGSEGKS